MPQSVARVHKIHSIGVLTVCFPSHLPSLKQRPTMARRRKRANMPASPAQSLRAVTGSKPPQM